MSAHLHPRIRLLLWVVLLAFGVDQGVALAHEVHPDAKGGHAWVRQSGVRSVAAGRLALDLPDLHAALPAAAVELPPLGAWTRVSTAVPGRETAPGAASLRSAYPRGPPA